MNVNDFDRLIRLAVERKSNMDVLESLHSINTDFVGGEIHLKEVNAPNHVVLKMSKELIDHIAVFYGDRLSEVKAKIEAL